MPRRRGDVMPRLPPLEFRDGRSSRYPVRCCRCATECGAPMSARGPGADDAFRPRVGSALSQLAHRRVRRDHGRNGDDPRRPLAAEARPRRCAFKQAASGVAVVCARSWHRPSYAGASRSSRGARRWRSPWRARSQRASTSTARPPSGSGSPTTGASGTTNTCTGCRSRTTTASRRARCCRRPPTTSRRGSVSPRHRRSASSSIARSTRCGCGTSVTRTP
jgi:hypothetical protein